MTIKKNKLFSSLVVILIISLPFTILAVDENQEAVSLLEKGQKLLRDNNFLEALQIFQELEGRFPDSKNLEIFIFNKAKSQYYLNQYTEAEASFEYFTNWFPSSDYLAHAFYFKGNCSYYKKDIKDAFESYKVSFNLTSDHKLESIVLESIKSLFQNVNELSLTVSDFSSLSDNKKCQLIALLADEYMRRGDIDGAISVKSTCSGLSDSNDGSSSNKGDDEILDVAVLLPFSGELTPFGQDIYNGVVIAADLFRQESGNNRYKLTPYDSKGDPVEAARLAKQISNSKSADVIIGPLTSQSSLTASAVLSGSNLPIISPAATEAGMTRLSTNSFQLSPNLELEGHLMAEYAINNLSADSSIILSSSETEHLRISRAFSERFEQLGGKTVAIEYFRSRDNDFGEYIRDIKRMILGAPPDSAFYVNMDGDTIDLDVVPVHLDCVFITGDSRQLRQLIPQVNFYNITGVFLGSDGWGDESIFKLGDNITRQAVFTSPFIESTSTDEYLKLSSAYDSKYGERPKRLSSLGYDAMKLVLQSFINGKADRESIAQSLKKTHNHIGASGVISFGEYRENIVMPFYKIQNGTTIKLNTDITTQTSDTTQ